MTRVLARSPFPSRFLRQANTGRVAFNVNRALAQASGAYVTFLSLDDVMLRTALDGRLAPVLDDPGIAFVAETTYDQIDDSGAIVARGLPLPVHQSAPAAAHDLLEIEFARMHTFFIQGAVFRRSVVQAVGGFDDDLIGDDIILRTKVFRHLERTPGLTFRLIPQAGLRYRTHGSNLHYNTERQIRTLLQWRDRYFPGRPLSEEGIRWIERWMTLALEVNDRDGITELARTVPEVRRVADGRHLTWRQTRKRWKRRPRRGLRSAFGLRSFITRFQARGGSS